MVESLKNLSGLDVRGNPDYQQLIPTGERVQEYAQLLRQVVFGQDRACLEVARAMVRTTAFPNPTRPEFIGMFLGPPGVGKTEMGRGIAKALDSKTPEAHLKVIDCSNFQEPHDVHKITGSPNSYVGYGDKPLIDPEFLKRRNVIVFDEIEKAHVALHRVLLSVMDQGRLQVPIGAATYKDVKQVELNFAQSSLICTSNVGSMEMAKAQRGGGSIGFHPESQTKSELQEIGRDALKKHWKHIPEFINRFDALVVFDSLTPGVLSSIFEKFIDEYNENQGNEPNILGYTRELRDWVIAETDTDLGGRELRRSLDRLVITPAAELKFDLPANVPFIADVTLTDPKRVIFWANKESLTQNTDQTEKVTSDSDNAITKILTEVPRQIKTREQRRKPDKARNHRTIRFQKKSNRKG